MLVDEKLEMSRHSNQSQEPNLGYPLKQETQISLVMSSCLNVPVVSLNPNLTIVLLGSGIQQRMRRKNEGKSGGKRRVRVWGRRSLRTIL
ncbi:hypothetical protein SLE2022_131240 [Rubroshorea leprosula]